MRVPSINLNGTVLTRAALHEQESKGGGELGRYSPRLGDATSSGTVDSDGAGERPESAVHGAAVVSSGAGSTTVLPVSHGINTVKAEEAAMGITDPDMALISAGKGRHSGATLIRSDSASLCGSGGAAASNPMMSSAGGTGRRAAAMTTLVEHLQARQKSPSVTRPAWSSGSSNNSDRDTSVTSVTTTAAIESSARAATGGLADNGHGDEYAAAGDRSVKPVAARPYARRGARAVVSSLVVQEAYVLGQPFRQHVTLTTDRTATTTLAGAEAAAATSRALRFRQNPSQYISALATAGDYVALGDRAGRVTVMRRADMTASQQVGYLEVERKDRACVATWPSARTKDTYHYFASQQAYSMAIDPLYSVDVTPTVSALAFLPQVSPAAYLLTANEKVPKLYKVMSVRQAAVPFRAVDKIDARTIGPLTAASRASTTTMKCVTRYALNHENCINSICPTTTGDQFVTADDLSLLLWCVDYPDTSIETYDLRPPVGEEVREAIRCVRAFPQEPFLLFVVTSAGNVRVLDTRQTLRWTAQTPQLFVNPPRGADGEFSLVTNSLSDCALSPCGRYIAGRDLMMVSLWDVRVAAGATTAGSGAVRRWGGVAPDEVHSMCACSAVDGNEPADRYCDSTPQTSGGVGLVRQWALHPYLHQHLDALYNLDLFFKPFDIQFMTRSQICTGGFNGMLYTVNVTDEGDGHHGVRSFQLPPTEDVSVIPRTPIAASPAANGPVPVQDAAGVTSLDAMELGACITLLSRPVMSVGATCGMVVSCGQVAMQLRYHLI